MRKTAAEARRTRERIVEVAVQQASGLGLSGLTIGALAETLDMSKAGVVGPFGSRAELQLAALDRAVEMFTEAVVAPGRATGPGLPCLYAVIDAWCAYLADSPFPNGCFVTAASCELDARYGDLRTRLHDTVTRWRGFLAEQITTAQAAGDLDPHLDPDDLVSLLGGLAMAANQEIQLLGDERAAPRARRLMRAALASQRPLPA
ncbi:TetR/AcrR family transcriptional regulator [Streptomyces sp. 5-8]|uniref:TetR/AcrR family transcriptional regulator n=1 Tax=Streptomyces musisoli TaxID=2802280 RepID=A0ABS1PE92_9ACTN|nr:MULTISPECIES: TetR/AcrR family transcriptional regulator [Streptomyces]MBL1110705.1 TetR/AcrR family transcriptional regulator [Streptomyces musisoli]MBY8846156.1 TetR/AcrR family transcriptional regulator [Streptomyces sp. SP2-10]